MIKKTNPRLKKFSWLLLLPLFLACNLLPNNPDPTPIPEEVPVMLSPSSMPPATAEPTESPTLTPTVEAAQTPTPEPVSSGPALLPAALYFLNTSGQIMRLEADAHTLRQITAEPDPILDFDISPTDSRII
jgi:hypothetical protein